ncbi:MAG: hypothetical protein HYU64_07270 [Armatimonadetes bacterium]|nr:hypothetical protein [Armatimonadota bacterium]
MDGIPRNSGRPLTARDAVKGNRPPDPSRITMHFDTPTRLKFEEHLAPNPEFHILIRNLLRRISLLTYFHGGFKLELLYAELIHAAQEVELTESRINRVVRIPRETGHPFRSMPATDSRESGHHSGDVGHPFHGEAFLEFPDGALFGEGLLCGDNLSEAIEESGWIEKRKEF